MQSESNGGWIGSLQHRLILLLGINHLLIYNQMNGSAQDGKSGLFDQACEALQGRSHGPCARSSVGNSKALTRVPLSPAYGCSLNSQRGYQDWAVICSSGFLRRNCVPGGTAVSLKDLHVLMLMEEILNDLTK